MRRARATLAAVTAFTAFTALFALAAPAARAETEGRVSFTNAYLQMGNPNATLDAALLRFYLKADRLGGRQMSVVVDARSDVVLTETEAKFNTYCRGKLDDPGCRDGAVRNVSLGQLKHLAGIYDAYVMFGRNVPNSSSFSLGRRTVYEAGLVTVDGLVYEKSFEKSRVGAFGGLMPDPLTRMVNADYPLLGSYYAYRGTNSFLRFGATVQGYLGSEGDDTGLDRATLFHQGYFKLNNSFSLGSFAQVDAVPGPEERLVYVDLTYRPSGRYRLRFNATRYRPIAFALSPQLLNGAFPDDSPVVTAYQGQPLYTLGRPEVLPEKNLTAAVTLGKVVAHYVTRNSLTPYFSFEYRLRDIDSKSALIATVGAYTYDPYDTGITARLRFQFQQGYDSNALRLGGSVEREVLTHFVLAGGADASQVTYTDLGDLRAGYSKSGAAYQLFGQARWDRPEGLSFFLEGQYYAQVRKRDAAEPAPAAAARPALTASDKIVLLGVTYRF